jgi:uncharacterized integral membrane protein (TIGR00698 family)
MSFSKEHRAYTLNGILFVGLFALSSLYLASVPYLAKYGISSLMIAIILGIFYGNTLHHRLPKEWAPGIHFCSKKLLRLAIILYGFRVSFQQMIAVGVEGLLLDVFIVASTLMLGYWFGVKVFKLDRDVSLLVSSGSAICGAAAVLAVEDVIKSEAYKATIAIATVVIFGTLSMFLFPILQHAHIFGFNETQYGIFAGASVHEVAQVVVAGSNVSPESATIAVIVKMTRVLLLVPVLLLLTIFLKPKTKQGEQKSHLVIPWFALIFLGVIGFNSLSLLPATLIGMINYLDILLLTMAMGAIGMETNLRKIKEVGLKPFYLAIVLFGWLMGSAYLGVKLF